MTRCPSTASTLCTASSITSRATTGEPRRTQRATRVERSTSTAAAVASSGTQIPPISAQPRAEPNGTFSIRPRATAAAAAASSPGTTAIAQETQNQGRSTGPGRTGCISSQSTVARGATTGPRHSASRATTSIRPRLSAHTPDGSAASSRGPSAV